jgi:hypothetical protein
LADPVALVEAAGFTVAGVFDGPGVVTASVVPSGVVGGALFAGSALDVPSGGGAAPAGVVFADGAARGAVASVSGGTGTVRADGRAASASVVGRVVRAGGLDVSVSSGDAGAAGRIVFGGWWFTDVVSAGAGTAGWPALAGIACGVAWVVTVAGVVSAGGAASPVATGFGCSAAAAVPSAETSDGAEAEADSPRDGPVIGRAPCSPAAGLSELEAAAFSPEAGADPESCPAASEESGAGAADEPEDGDVTGGSVASSGSGRAIGCVEVFVSAVPGPSGSAAFAIP